MVAINRFYMHDAATTNSGTLPGASTISLAHSTPDVTATGASTNRSADGTIGAGQQSGSLSTVATKAEQFNWYRRFLSAPIAAQTISGTQLISCAGAGEQSNTNSSVRFGYSVAVWRPSTGAVVGRIYDAPGPIGTIGAVTTEATWSSAASNTSDVTAQDGDILVFELWSDQSQSMATSYTNTAYYDGTTEGSTANNASYVNFANAITMQETARIPRNPAINHQNPGLL